MLVTDPTEAEVQEKIDEQMSEIYNVVGICLGIPADTFKWEYYDKSKTYQTVGEITPVEFYQKYVKQCFNVDEKVCVLIVYSDICSGRFKIRFFLRFVS